MGIRVSPLYESEYHRNWLKGQGAEARGILTAIVREEAKNGTWKDTKAIHFNVDGTPSHIVSASGAVANIEVLPTERNAFLAAFAAHPFGEKVGAEVPDRLSNKQIAQLMDLPPFAREHGELFFFRNENGAVTFVHQRIEVNSAKVYVAWHLREVSGSLTWFASEPEGALPIYGAHLLPGAAGKVIYIHESARAAEGAARIAREAVLAAEAPEGPEEKRSRLGAHPWGEELAGAVHVGWLSGGMNVERTSWAGINSAAPSDVVIVADNDESGLASIPKIAKSLFMTTSAVKFNSSFPVGFDMGDPYPDSARRWKNGKLKPLHLQRLELMKVFATWATEAYTVPTANGTKVKYRVRRSFARAVGYVKNIDRFVVRSAPTPALGSLTFDKAFRSFSDVAQLSNVVVEDAETIFDSLAYVPGSPTGAMMRDSMMLLNTYRPPLIPRRRGDVRLFDEFMRYLVPGEEDRLNLLRIIATIVAHPERRIRYSVLLISTQEGVGKNTLTDAILQPLVGPHNVSVVGESGITGSFNGWAANRRVIIVPEIYEGHSFTTANKLKSMVTDDRIMVNEKNQPAYEVDNNITFFACSNSLQALKIAEADRRWFLPQLSEVAWPRERFAELHDALSHGDLLPAIMDWAHEYGDYVQDGATAPRSTFKDEFIEGSISGVRNETDALTALMKSLRAPPDGYKKRLLTMISKLPSDGKMSVEGRMANNEAKMFLRDVIDGPRAASLAIPVPLAVTSKEALAHATKAVTNRERIFDRELDVRKRMLKEGLVDGGRVMIGNRMGRIVCNRACEDLVRQFVRWYEEKMDGGGQVLQDHILANALYRAALVFPSELLPEEMGADGGGIVRETMHDDWERDE
jgi:hypothetical protein